MARCGLGSVIDTVTTSELRSGATVRLEATCSGESGGLVWALTSRNSSGERNRLAKVCSESWRGLKYSLLLGVSKRNN